MTSPAVWDSVAAWVFSERPRGGSRNVKATTTEKLGFVGREEGIAVHAVALLLPL